MLWGPITVYLFSWTAFVDLNKPAAESIRSSLNTIPMLKRVRRCSTNFSNYQNHFNHVSNKTFYHQIYDCHAYDYPENYTCRIHFQDSEEVIEEPLDGTTSLGEFPWTVYLEERIGNGSFLYKCGGALVTSSAVVTAGHCIANARDHPERFAIIAGDWDRRHNQERLPSQRRSVSRIILHPEYYSGSLFNDIAVLILDIPLNDSLANIGNVCLPTQGSEFTESNCVLTSWGASPSNPSKEEPIQRFITMPLVESSTCEGRLRTNSTLGRRFRMHRSFICAGGKVGLDSCKGSGGSPLVCQRNGSYVLAGILSWGVSCGEGIPVVFTNVAVQSSWVTRVIDSLDDNVVHFV
ncbi:AAEL012842-PA [Aedes aegypti]|uniref:AAEL012842-PA n=1 Tax=Aedes aegypti TaxID=7159 RepID=Q16KX2_AEDAE|nr:AAEL012842-PA [Aedes aegypti]